MKKIGIIFSLYLLLVFLSFILISCGQGERVIKKQRMKTHILSYIP